MILPPSSRIAYQGEPGAFSEQAILEWLGHGVVTVPRRTFSELFEAIHGDADYILAPVRNSLAGRVDAVWKFLAGSGLRSIGEYRLQIDLHLIGVPGATLNDVSVVRSHPVALLQCRNFLSRHQNFQAIPSDDSAGSVRETVAQADPTQAAIAGLRAANLYGGVVLSRSVQDHIDNFTDFLLLGPNPAKPKV